MLWSLFFLRRSELFGETGLGQQNFTVIFVLLSWSRSSPSPFSGASIISKQLSLQPMPRPNRNPPITGQVCVWIWAALLNSNVCQYRSLALHLSFSFCHSLSFCFSLWLIKFFLPTQPTSFNMHPRATPKCQFKPPPVAAFCSFKEFLSVIIPAYFSAFLTGANQAFPHLMRGVVVLVNLVSVDTRFIKHSIREKGRVTKRDTDKRRERK